MLTFKIVLHIQSPLPAIVQLASRTGTSQLHHIRSPWRGQPEATVDDRTAAKWPRAQLEECCRQNGDACPAAKPFGRFTGQIDASLTGNPVQGQHEGIYHPIYSLAMFQLMRDPAGPNFCLVKASSDEAIVMRVEKASTNDKLLMDSIFRC